MHPSEFVALQYVLLHCSIARAGQQFSRAALCVRPPANFPSRILHDPRLLQRVREREGFGDRRAVLLFCEGLSLCPRGHSFRRDDTDMSVFCFSVRADADKFQQRFGGEFIHPKDRPKWPGSRR
jgi:hypothetical protein